MLIVVVRASRYANDEMMSQSWCGLLHRNILCRYILLAGVSTQTKDQSLHCKPSEVNLHNVSLCWVILDRFQCLSWCGTGGSCGLVWKLDVSKLITATAHDNFQTNATQLMNNLIDYCILSHVTYCTHRVVMLLPRETRFTSTHYLYWQAQMFCGCRVSNELVQIWIGFFCMISGLDC